MNIKKAILFLLMVVSIASMVLVVFTARNRSSLFKRPYEEFVRKNTEALANGIRKNLDQVFNEVKSLSGDGLVKNVFMSASLGESADKYSTDFDSIKRGIAGCNKIQAIDSDGKIIFSTETAEINTQKIKDSILNKLKNYFTSEQNGFIYFLDQKQFVTIYPITSQINSSLYQGFVSIYYNASRLTQGIKQIPSNKIDIPFSYDNYVFLSSGKVDSGDIAKIVNFYNNPTELKKEPINPTIGGFAQVDGLKVIYYTKHERFIPIQAWLFLLVDFLLLGATVFALIQLMREEKMYKDIPLASLREEPRRDDRIRGLVDDIEENQNFGEEDAKKGIEDMILTNDIDLTQFRDNLQMETEEGAMASDEKLEEFNLPSMEENESLAIDNSYINANEEFSLKTQPEDELIEYNTFDSVQPSSETTLFAEHDRILSNVDNQAFENEEKSPAIEPEKTEEPTEFLSLESMDTSEYQSPIQQELNEPQPLEEKPEVPEEMEELPSIDTTAREGAEEEIISFEPSIQESFKTDQMEEPFTLNTSENEEINLSPEEVVVEEPISEAPTVEEPAFELPEAQPEEVQMELPSNEVEEKQMEIAEESPVSKDEGFIDLDLPEGLSVEEIKEENEDVMELPSEEVLPEEIKPAEVVEEVPLSTKTESGIDEVLSQPPVRISSIFSVEDYGRVALDLAKNSLGIKNVFVLQKNGDKFQTIIQSGFESNQFVMEETDPVYQIFISKRKSLDIKGNLQNTRYLKERFENTELKNLDEIFIVPVIRHEDIMGIAIYGREKGTAEPTNYQRSELFNLGFLQDI